MQRQMDNTYEDFYNFVMEKIKVLPARLSQIRQAAYPFKHVIDQSFYQIYLQQFETDNEQFVRISFIGKMMDILEEIKPELSNFPKYQSISYLQTIIYKHLDEQIFQGTRISKIREKDLIKNKQDIDLASKFFLQMTMILNELFQIMKEHYEISRSDCIDGVVYETIYQFSLKNANWLFMKDLANVPQKKQIEENRQTFFEKTKNILGGIGTKIYSIYSGGQKTLLQQPEVFKVQKYDDMPTVVQKELEEWSRKSLQQVIVWLNHDEKNEFLQIFYEFLSVLYYEKEYFQSSKVCKRIIEQVTKKTNQLYLIQSSKGSFSEFRHCKYVVLLYRCLQNVYYQNSLSRLFLHLYCKQYAITHALKNPYQIITAMEDPLENESKMLRCLRGLLIKQVIGQIRMSKGEQLLEENLEIEQQFNRISLFEFKKKYEQLPKINFQKLTNCKTRVITFLFNGFLSEDCCNLSLWQGLMPQVSRSEVYSVVWSSKTTSQLEKYGINSALQIGFSLATKAHPILRALSLLSTIYKNVRENPFYTALQEARKVGQFVGQFICSNLRGYFINLVGFSLGTQVISSILTKMSENSCQNMISKICLIGGAADKGQIQNLIQNSQTPLRVVNFFSDNDLVLKYILKLVKPYSNPIGLTGLRKIENHEITNQNCTDFIDGHSKYRQKLEVLTKLHNFNQ